MQYKSEIDGLRALAVLPVIFFHFDLNGFHGGFIGVDIFFVISGYLITKLLYKDISAQKFSLLDFYERRARRLLPAAFLVLFCSYIAGYYLFAPQDFKAFGESLHWFAFFASNIHFMNEAGYFDLPSQVKPILHTWSLSVEEQFYFIFPIILYLIYQFRKNNILTLIWVLIILSFSISVYTTYEYKAFAFYMLPSRGWELLLGSVLALGGLPRLQHARLSNFIAITGLALIFLAMALYDKNTPFPGFAALIPCIGTVFIIWSNLETKNFIGKILSWKPLVFIGLISYPLYLWHWPLVVFPRYYLNRELLAVEVLLLIVSAFVLSYFTWKFIEQPIRARKIFINQKAILASAFAGIILFFAIGRVTDVHKGFPNRLPEPARTYAMGVWDKHKNIKKCQNVSINVILKDELCPIGSNKDTLKPRFIVWGDSHANMLLPMLSKQADKTYQQGFLASQGACPPILNLGNKKCSEFTQAIFKLIKRNNIRNIILVGRWGLYIHKRGFSENLTKTLNLLKNRNIWVMETVPDHIINVPLTIAKEMMRGNKFETLALPTIKYKEHRSYLRKTFLQNTDVKFQFIEMIDILCGARKHCLMTANGRSLYFDNDHLSTHGAHYIASAFTPIFEKIQKNNTNEEKTSLFEK